jgi:pilus assembly protein CpaC
MLLKPFKPSASDIRRRPAGRSSRSARWLRLQQCVLWAIVALIGSTMARSAKAQVAGASSPAVPKAPGGPRNTAPARDLNNMIAVSGPSSHFAAGQPESGSQPPPPAPGLIQNPAPAAAIPRVIPLEPLMGAGSPATNAPQPRVITFPTDSTGLRPERPSLTTQPRSQIEVADDLNNLIELVKAPEAEISLVEGQSKILQTRRELSRIVIANPLVADVEIITDQPGSRLLNVYGRTFGTTSLTIWDQTNRSVSFLVRVSLDTKDLELRIRQAFPGAEIKVRQVGTQVILDGQSPDSKTMADILQLVTSTLMSSLTFRGAGAGGGGVGGGMGMGGAGGGMSGGQSGGGGGGMGMGGGGGMGMGGGVGGGGAGGAARGLVIINRVTVPGPRQVLLHVKIAEINRTAIRSIGVSWVYARGNSIIGSAAGDNALMNFTANSAVSQATNKRGFVLPGQQTVGATNAASPTGNAPLFGVFNSGHFSMFVDALRTNDLAKILAEPNLVALDGQPARFLVGGLFPFPVPQSSSIPGGTAVVTVQFQRFGTILTFLPQILPNDVIRLDVEPVISQLAPGTTVNGGAAPQILERSARTVVELREGQTLAIAGLLQSLTTNSTIRVPGLGDLPIVGPWFSNSSVQTIETETIVLVTPELISPLDKKDVTEAPGDRVYQPNDAEFYLLGRIEGKLGREFRATVGQQDPLNLMRHFQSEQQWVIGPHGHAD